MTRKADIVIPVYRGVEVTRDCIESVFERTGDALGQVILVDDQSPEAQMQPMLQTFQRDHPETVLLQNEKNLGFVSSANRGMALRKRDVVLLNSDTIVTSGWLTEMLRVAYSSDRVASVVPLSNNGALCSVPLYCQSNAMEDLRGHDLRLHRLPESTIVPTGVGFCLLLKDIVLNMVGLFDPAFGRGYNEENDWAMRAQTLGLVSLRANRALVYHLGSVSFGLERDELDRRTGKLLLQRYPYYLSEVNAFSATPESRVAAHYVQRRLARLSAIINIEHLKGLKINGTGVYALELATNLKRHTDINVSVCGASENQTLALFELGIPTLPIKQLESQQVFHHPSQIFEPQILDSFLTASGHTVITFQDLITFRTPSPFSSFEEFERYGAISFAALHSAQAVIAISEHNRQEIIRDFHVPPERVHTIYLGIASSVFERKDPAKNSQRLAFHGITGPYFLYLGSDYAHKNVKLLLAAYAMFRHRFTGGQEIPRLVLAGSRTRSLGSMYDRDDNAWPPGVIYLGTVDEQDVPILYQGAISLIFPSAYEGFGLPILEAMAAGTPVICSHLSSLPEVAGEGALYIEKFSADEIAHHMLTIESSSSVRRRLIEAGRAQIKKFSWAETARKTAELYEDVVNQPSVSSLFQRRMFTNLVKQASLLPKHQRTL